MAAELERAGVPVAARLEEPLLAEGGDFFWLDARTLCAGRGYRTNSDGIRALEQLLGVEMLVFDLPHFHGPASCLHLLSLLSPLADDLVARLSAAPAGAARAAARRARDRDRRGAGRGVRDARAERARARAAGGA